MYISFYLYLNVCISIYLYVYIYKYRASDCKAAMKRARQRISFTLTPAKAGTMATRWCHTSVRIQTIMKRIPAPAMSEMT